MTQEFIFGALSGLVAGGVLGPLFLVLVRAYLGTGQKAKEQAQVAADWLAFVEPVVSMVDALDIPGPEKFVHAEREFVAELKRQGITGDAARVVKKHIPFLIELAHSQLRKVQANQPGAPAAG